MAMIHTVYSLASALPRGCLRYGMATEESFQLLGEDSTSDLSANRKRKSKAAVENTRTGKSRRWSDAEVDRLIELLEERPCLWDVFCKEYRKRESGLMKRLKTNSQLSHYIGEISLFFSSLYPVSSLSSFSFYIILLFQHFKQSNSSETPLYSRSIARHFF